MSGDDTARRPSVGALMALVAFARGDKAPLQPHGAGEMGSAAPIDMPEHQCCSYISGIRERRMM